VETLISDFTGYKNRNSGMWIRGEEDTFRNLKLADNAIGYTHAAGGFGRYDYTSRVLDSLFVGETDNIGNPATPAEKAYGRSLPEPAVPDFPIRGYEFYDYQHHLDNVTFRNFEDNATRKTGAISYLLYTSFGMSSNNTVQHAKFINAKPVYFPPLEQKWSNDDYGNGSYKTAVFHDLDGSVDGVPGSFILVNDENNEIAIDNACEIKPAWNAAVCKGDIGRMSIANPTPANAPRPGQGPGGVAALVAGARGPSGPPQPPIVVSRNGKSLTLTAETNIRAGSEVKVDTQRPSVALRLTEMDKGSWVMFELPGFTKAASGAPADSLDALRKASDTAYFKDKDALWVKVVSTGQGADLAGAIAGGASVQVSR
jgi:cell migration-inducing and hyaluronan-binding protein